VITDYEQVYWAAKGNKIPVMVLVRNSEYACQIMKNGSKNKKCPPSAKYITSYISSML
jgi:hypothetical protein